MSEIKWFILLKMSSKVFLAHRGSWHNHAIENTLEAFENTKNKLSNHLHGFECDLRQLDPNNPLSWVIFHDETMGRFNDTDSKIDPSIPLITNQYKSKMPTLTGFANWIKKLTVPIIINIEIKHGSIDGIKTLRSILIEANKHNLVTYIYSSFDKDIMNHITLVEQNYSYLIKEINDFKELNITSQTNAQFIGISHENATSFIFEQLKKIKISGGIYFKDMTQYKANIHHVMNNEIVSLIFIED